MNEEMIQRLRDELDSMFRGLIETWRYAVRENAEDFSYIGCFLVPKDRVAEFFEELSTSHETYKLGEIFQEKEAYRIFIKTERYGYAANYLRENLSKFCSEKKRKMEY